jgi:nucleoside phosphorylase
VREVLVLAATPLEAALLQSSHRSLVVTGIGAVNTAHALTRYLVTRPTPSLVIQTGIAGAYVPAGIPVGSVVLANAEIYGDLGVMTPDGWRPRRRNRDSADRSLRYASGPVQLLSVR